MQRRADSIARSQSPRGSRDDLDPRRRLPRWGRTASIPEERPSAASPSTASGSIERPSRTPRFGASCEATGYVTFAERPPDPADYPDADPALLVPGSVVFCQADRRRSTSTTAAAGGSTCPARPGATPRARRARSTGATTTRSCTSPTRTSRPTRAGRARSCRRRPSGSSPPAAGSRARIYAWGDELAPGGKRDGEHLARGVPLAEPRARRLRAHLARSARSRRTATASSTWPATSGSGRATGSRRATRRRSALLHAAQPARRARRAESIDPALAGAHIPRKVLKGGSLPLRAELLPALPPGGAQPQTIDTSTCHLGFRCIVATHRQGRPIKRDQ